MPVFARGATSRPAGPRSDIGFSCSGSSRLPGRPVVLVRLGASTRSARWPPINESHVEMDGAWALYEAWVKIQTGEVDTALVYGFGKSSAGVLRRRPGAPARPVHVAPLWPDSVSLAGAPGPGAASTPGCGTSGRWPRWPPLAAPTPRRTRTPVRKGELVGRRAARRADVRRPAAQARLPADHRRRGRDRARRRRPGPRAVRPARPGSAASTTASTPHAPRRPRPHRARRRRRCAAERPAASTAGRRRRAARAVQPPGADPARRRSASATTSRSTRRAARSPPTR